MNASRPTAAPLRLIPAGLLLALLPCLTVACRAQDPARPNVIIILVDDLGWMDLSCQGSRFYETPNVDRLAATGMRFTQGYAACAVCSPTRAAVMTGRYPARIGITDWIRARFQGGKDASIGRNPTQYVGNPRRRLLCPPNPFWLEHEEITLAELLKDAGYATCHVGKWHLGPPGYFPTDQGFDENHGGCDYGQPPSYYDPFTNKRLPQGIPTLPPKKTGQYLTDREADQALDFIIRHKDRPFFLYLAHYAVHTPIQPKGSLLAKYQNKPTTTQKNAAYATMVESVDQSTGRLLDLLDKLDLADRTLIIFTSDNGGLLGSTSNAPLRSGKGFPYEGGIRVPWIIRWPGVTRPGSLCHVPIISCDILPTVCQAVGIQPPADRPIDGVSLVPLLRGQSIAPRPLLWHFPHYRALGHSPYSIIRQGDWKLIRFWEGPRFMLFNLADDPGEQNDLAQAMPDRVRQLDAQLLDALHAQGAKLPRPNPDYSDR